MMPPAIEHEAWRSRNPELAEQLRRREERANNRPRCRCGKPLIHRGQRIRHPECEKLLIRLENSGWISSAWENIDESAEGRRRRRYYRLTPLGQSMATHALRIFE